MKNKNAFSMVELATILAIVGFLTVITVHTLKDKFSDFYSRYYTAYDALGKAVYNTYTDTYCRIKAPDKNAKIDCLEDGKDYSDVGRPFPDSPYKLCKRLSEYLNLSHDSECDKNTGVITNAENKEFKEKDKNGKEKNLQFALANSYKVYFSDKKSIKVNDKDVKYYIVYVDLNGSENPNSPEPPDNKNSKNAYSPDIVPFAITFKGDIIPVGFPIYSKNYASARVISSLGNQTQSYTIDEARQIAFGKKAYADIPLTLIPQIDSALPAGAKSTIAHPTQPLGNDQSTGMDCKEGTYNCTVKIDENLDIRR